METEKFEIKGRYEDFIGIYDYAIPESICTDIIKAFEYSMENGSVYCEDNQFNNSNAGRFNWSLDLTQMSSFMDGDPITDINKALQKSLDEYVHVFGHMKGVSLYSIVQKVQKTPEGGGYHVWHDENSGIDHSGRLIVWMFYLNDNFEGGETEFLYYKKRITPKSGTLLLWPAGLTHAHRGGLVLKDNKFVVTGWFYVR